MKSFSLAVVVLVGASTFPSISASSCTGSTPNWKDLYGDGCEWYESADKPGCPTHGQMYDGGMGVANDNCCYCEGTGVSYRVRTWKILFIHCSPHASKYHLSLSRLQQWLHLHGLPGHGLQLYHIQLTLLQFQKLQLHLCALEALLVG